MNRDYKEEYRRLVKHTCWATLTTPFAKDGAIDEAGLRKNVRFYVPKSTPQFPIGLQACGTYGESLFMTDEERRKVIRIVQEEVDERVPVAAVVLNGDGCLKRIVEMGQYCQDLGIRVINVAPPTYYFRPDAEGIFQWFKSLAGEIDMGIVIYNLAGRFNFYMDVPLVKRLAEEIPKIVGMKHAPATLEKRLQMLQEVGHLIAVIEGAESYAPYVMPLGSPGYMSSSVLFAPDLMQQWTRAIVEKNEAVVRDINRRFQAYRSFQAQNPAEPPSVLKAALNMVGLAGGYPRLPLRPLDEDLCESLRKAIRDLGLNLSKSEN